MKKVSMMLLLLALFGAGCKKTESLLSIGLIKPSMNHLPVSLAIELGYLDGVVVRWFNSGWELNEALVAHGVDCAVMPFTYAWADVAAGKDVRILSFLERESDGLIASRDIATLSELEGKKIGVLRASTLDAFARLIATEQGVTPQFISFRTPMDMASALQSGDVAAISYYVPSIFRLDASRFHVIRWYSQSRPMHPCCDLVSHDAALATKTPALATLQQAIGKAMNYMESHPEAVVDFVQQRFALDADVARASLAHTAYRLGLDPGGQHIEAEVFALLKSAGYVTGDASVGQMYEKIGD